MGVDFSMGWEVPFMVWLQELLGEKGGVIGFFSIFGEELLLTLVFGTLYWGFRKKAGIHVGITLMTSLLWNPLIKNAFCRIRPYIAHSELRCLKPVAKGDTYDSVIQGFSFPSSHSTAAVTCYGSIARFFKTRWLYIAAGILVLLVGLSRILVGVHYPTDVIGGYLLGIFSIIVIELLEKVIKDRRILYLLLALTAVPGFFYCTTEDFYTCAGLLFGVLPGILFEERFVRFEDARNIIKIIVRVLLGAAVFMGMSEGLKAVFRLFADSGKAALLLRTVRYACAAFVAVGVYPMLYKPLRLEEKRIEE